MTAPRLVSAFTYLATILVAVAAPAAAQDPRIYQYYPANFSTVGQQTITVSFYGCSSAQINNSSAQVFVNGVAQSAGTTYPSGSCSLAYKSGFSTQVTLRSGGNTIDMKFCNIYQSCATASIWVSYTAATPGVAVTPDGGSATVYVNTYNNFVFRIENTGNVQATPMTGISACTAPVTACSVPPAGGAMAPGERRDIAVQYNSTGAGSGQLGMSVYWLEYPSTSDNGSATITALNPPVYSVTVSVADAEPINMSAGATSLTQRYTIANTSQYTTQQSTFQIDMTQSGIVTSCPVQNPITLVPGDAQSILVTCQIGSSTTASSGTVRLTASTYSPVVMSNYVERTVNTTPYYAVSVTPIANPNPEPARATSGTRSFTVRNDSRNTGGTSVTLSRICAYAFTCSPQMSPVTIYEGSSATVDVPYGIQWTGTYGTVQLNAGIGGASNSGSSTVNTTASYAVVVTPEFPSVPVPPGGQSGTARFTIFNNSTNTGATRSFALSTTCSLPLLTSCGASPGSIDLPDQATASLTATLSFNVSPNGTSGTATLRANSSGVPEGTGSTTITTSPYYSVIASPVNVSEPPLAGGATSATVQFQVYNNSRNTTGSQTYQINLAASGSQITAGGCPAAPSPASVNLAQGGFTNQVYLTCNVGSVGSSGTMTVTPSAAGFVATAQAATVMISPSYQVIVTADSIARTLPQRTSRDSLRFKVKDASRNTPTATSYSLVANCYAPTSCPSSQGSVSLAQGDSAFRYLAYDVGRVGNTGTVILSAQYSTAYGAASTTVFATPSYTAAIVPALLTRSVTMGASLADTVRIQNTSWNTTQDIRVEPRAQTCTNVVLRACTISSFAQTLAQDAFSWPIVVRYSAAAPGSESVALDMTTKVAGGSVTKTPGSIAVTVSAGGPLAIASAGMNGSGTVDRELCLTISAALNAAYTCGDLRVVHPLPSTITMNRPRTPTLVYNSRHSAPSALVGANVLYTGAPVPDSLEATISVSGYSTITKRFGWNSQCASQMCRIVVAVPATAAMTTGIYPFTMQTRAITAAGTTLYVSGMVSDTLVIVNRSQSPFGAGWWLSGLEQLVTTGSARLWVSGDGSTRLYSQVGTSDVYTVQPSYDRPDTLLRVPGTGWRRLLGDGAYVEFDDAGRHKKTVNALGDTTSFGYDLALAGTPLNSIRLPVPITSTANRIYSFEYGADGPGITLNRIVAPSDAAARIVTASRANGWLNGLTDPDGYSRTFTYLSGRMKELRNKWNDLTSFAYDGAGGLTSAQADLSRTGSAPIAISFRAAETQSAISSPDRPVPTGAVFTHVDGARLPSDVGDTTNFYVNRWGLPDTIVSALGYRTQLRRTDARFPAVVVSVIAANGFEKRSYLNERALSDSLVDVNPLANSQNATTRVVWNNKWNQADSIVSATGATTTFSYDPVWPLRLWSQVGSSTQRQVKFDYNGNHQVKTLLPPGNPAGKLAKFDYDSVLGNVKRTTTPRGFITRFFIDSVGRSAVVHTPTDTTNARSDAGLATSGVRLTTTFDRMGRALSARTTGGTQESLVQNTYDREGPLTQVDRTQTPATAGIGTLTNRWRYDAAGRAVAAVAPDNAKDSTVFDPAGNPIEMITRRGDRITMQYTALNQLRERRLSDVSYPCTTRGIAAFNAGSTIPYNTCYPRLPLSEQNATTITGELATFTYDATGALLTADNDDAKVLRIYYPNGLLRLDSLHIRTFTGNDFTQHAYGLSFEYDRDGNRIVASGDFGAGAGTNTTYGYDTGTGELTRVGTVFGSYDFTYTDASQLKSIAMPGSMVRKMGYDIDGALVGDTVQHLVQSGLSPLAAGVYRSTLLKFDARGKVLNSANSSTIGLHDNMTNVYSTLGYLTQHSYSANRGGETGSNSENLSLDALGNTISGTMANAGAIMGYSQSSSSNATWTYAGLAGRLSKHLTGQGTYGYVYDVAGNVAFDSLLTTFATNHANYYDALNRLRAMDYRAGVNSKPALKNLWTFKFDEYRYDALGRRILVRSRRSCYGNDTWTTESAECEKSFIRRTFWDGDQELYEIQMPGDNSASAATLEADSTGVTRPALTFVSTYFDRTPFYGRVTYVQGAGIDQPLLVTRYNYAEYEEPNPARVFQQRIGWVPHWNTRGEADYGSAEDGGVSHCETMQGTLRCVAYHKWPAAFTPYRQQYYFRYSWQGSLLEDKREGSGFLFRRNRYYDATSGRFTQEDPIGLAGGMNLYGFADGDPVNFGDPLGLCPEDVGGDGKTETVKDCSAEVRTAWADKHVSINPNTNWTDVDPGLKDAVVLASMDLRKDFYVSAGKEGGHSPNSTHHGGWAADVSRVNGTKFADMNRLTARMLGNQVGATITNFLPYGRGREVFTPGMAFRFDMNLSAESRNTLMASHFNHVHVSVIP